MTSVNPYTTKAVKKPSMFFGRAGEMETIRRCLNLPNPRSVIVIGGRKIGKTSLLYQIRSQLLQMPEDDGSTLIPVYFDLYELGSLNMPVFYEHLVKKIVSSVQQYKDLSISLPTDLTGDPYQVFLQHMQAIYHQCSVHIASVKFVFLLDEMERLLGDNWESLGKDIASNLRHLINNSGLHSFIALIITGFRGVNDHSMEDIGSMLGNDVTWIRLGVLTETECRNLITVLLSSEVQEKVVDTVYELSGGHPFITQHLMQQAWQLDSKNITLVDISHASQQFNDEVSVFISWEQKFEELDIAIYQALARSEAPVKLGKVREQVNSDSVKDALDFLCYTGVVFKQDKKYAIAGRLFQDWFLQRTSKEQKTMENSKPSQEADAVKLSPCCGPLKGQNK